MMLAAAAAAFAGASVQSATGFGFALVLTPALFAVLDPFEAVTTLLLLGAALNLLVLADGGLGPIRWRSLAPMLLFTLPGLFAGALLLEALSKAVLQLAVGIAVMVAAAIQLRRRGAARRDDSLGAAAVAGLAAGTLGNSISISGPPLVLWLDRMGTRPEEMRASLSAAFLALNVTGGAVLLATVDGTLAGLDVVLPLLALVVAGHLAGAAIFRRLDPARFTLVALALVVCTGAASAVAGATAL